MKLGKKLNDKALMISLILCFMILNMSIFWQLNVDAAVNTDTGSNSVTTIALTGEAQLEQQRLKQEEARQKEEAQKNAEAALDAKFQNLQQQVQSYLQKLPGTFGFMMSTTVKVGNREVVKTIGYNQNESFKMASTYKVPVILYLYEQAAQNKLNLQDKLVYQARFYSTGTGSLQYKSPGGSYSISELASLAIRQSDNVALAILIDKLGRENILAFMKSLGGTAVYDGTPFGTPNDLVLYIKAVDNLKKQYPDQGKFLIADLKNTIFNDRIRAGTPDDIEVAHKIGNLGGVVNDVGIVYAPKGPYFLSIMSKNVPNDVAAAEAEAQVAKMIYEAIGK